MADVLAVLRGTLADRYTVLEELGAGGMATVYLAHDTKLERQVAIKVLKPELAAVLGAERFLREVKITAQLEHPHILGLYDSGEADGLLYYVMPYVGGETLRQRLEREKQLPLEEALQIARDVAEALGYAHSRGVIHRDIKPENILLESEQALVADFGIARAVTEAGGAKLTETGLAIGTPAYMSPEQGSGRHDLDGRTDLYALGCVLYEMLAGHPPFMGSTAHEVMARHSGDAVPPLRSGRATIPEPIAEAVEQALAKVPADRFRTAQAFSAALSIDAVAYRRRQKWVRVVRKAVLGVAGGLVLSAALAGVNRYRAATGWRGQPVDANTVAVLPFRVTATSAEAQALQAMPDLLMTVLTGDVGPRAVDFGSLLRRRDDWEARGQWGSEEAPLRLAASFRAGVLLEGSVVEAGARIVVNALLRAVPSGEEVARTSLEVNPDSVHVLPHRLVVNLLGEQLGEDVERLASLEDQDPDAVMEYMAGAAAYREGRYEEGMRHFARALDIDSTFGEAAVRLLETGIHPSVDQSEWSRRQQRAEALRGGLSRRDQLAVDILDPRAMSNASDGEWLGTARAWTRAAPEDPWAWAQYARALSHAGPTLGRRGWVEEVRRALEESWKLDSITAGSVGQHVHQAIQLGDVDWLRRVAPRYLVVADTTDPTWPAFRWAIALVTGDSGTVRDLRDQAEAGTWPELTSGYVAHRLMWICVEALVGCADARRLVDLASAHTETLADTQYTFIADYVLSVHQGRMHRFAEIWNPWVPPLGPVAEYLPPGAAVNPFVANELLTYASVYRGLDSIARVAADSQSAFFDRGQWEQIWIPWYSASLAESGVTYDSVSAARDRVRYRCVLEKYRALSGDTTGVRTRAHQIARRAQDLGGVGICAATAEAFLERHNRMRNDGRGLDRVDSLVQLAPRWEYPVWPVILARLRRERGDYERALAFAQSRPRSSRSAAGTVLRLAFLYEEGRAAELLGDTATAIRAYQDYLTLRTDPDPGPVQAEVDSVRAALNALRRSRRGG